MKMAKSLLTNQQNGIYFFGTEFKSAGTGFK
jgi:hypothetical protein